MQKDLRQFEQLLEELKNQYIVSKTDNDIYRLELQGGQECQSVVSLVALTHGEEVIGLHLLSMLLQQLISKQIILKGTLYLILANRQAYLKNQRYIDMDLNRAYGGDGAHDCHEYKRAELIKPIIEKSDYIIDIHQCMHETLSPFAFAADDAQTISWLQGVILEAPIIIRENITRATTLTSYGFLKGKKAVTLEVGKGGVDDKQLTFGIKAVAGFLDYAWSKGDVDEGRTSSLSSLYKVRYFQPYSRGKVRFIGDLPNFALVTKGQIIAYVDGSPIEAPHDGKILFYPHHWFDEGLPTKADGLFILLE